MIADHIFIFTPDKGKIADQLVNVGFSEGSNRIHAGQGTTNRKFYFENFFLEILWVHDEEELKSENTSRMGLWQRSEFFQNNFSPFGLCLVNNEVSEELFKNCYKYQPEYFPAGMCIEILKNEDNPSLPWTFKLPFKGQKKYDNEPIIHENGIGLLTKYMFECKNLEPSNFLVHFESQPDIVFKPSNRNWLHLTFDNAKQGKEITIESLFLTIKY
jgi:hypothetical protein